MKSLCGAPRLEGWEQRLFAEIESVRNTPYTLGSHDCFKVACQVIKALTGVDLWLHWEGRYATSREARRLIVQYHPGGFTAAFSKLFGSEPISIKFAVRGDIAEFVQEGEPHLGIVVGSSVAVLGPEGLAFVPLTACLHSWRIG